MRNLPGDERQAGEKDYCDSHPEVRAVTRIQGETDSFGAEYLYMCRPCYEKYKADSSTPTIGTCAWCKDTDVEIFPTRDLDEGMNGPVYEVCQPCMTKQAEAAAAELDWLDSQPTGRY